MFRKTGLQILENGLIGPKNDHLDDQEGRILYSSESHKGYKIREYCDRFLHALKKCSSKVANIILSPPPRPHDPTQFLPPLPIQERIDCYLNII